MGKILAYTYVPTLLLAAVFHFIFGQVDVRVFAFPVNIAILLILVGGLYVLNREKGECRWVVAFSSGYAGVMGVVLVALCCLLMVFSPGLKFQHSWIFLTVLLLFIGNLFLVILRYRGKNRIRFYLNHVGLFVMLVALVFGSADMVRMRAAVNIGECIDKAYTQEGIAYSLGYPLLVESFDVEFYENRMPAEFRAEVSSGDERRILRVNHPWHKSWKEDIYLTGYNTEAGSASEYCILEFVVQPWKYIVLTGLLLFVAGALMLLWGGKYRV